MTLQAETSFLLIVDVQERLVPAIAEADAAIRGCATLLRAAPLLGVETLATEHYAEGLGPLVPALKALIPAGAVLPKVHFAAGADDDIARALERLGRRQAVIAGMEAHVCVQQTALHLLEAGYRVAVAADAVASRQPSDKELALARMAHHGVDIVSVEMVLFEWLHIAQHPAFKSVLALLK